MEPANQFSLQSILSTILPGFVGCGPWYWLFFDLNPSFVKENGPIVVMLVLFTSVIVGQIIDFGAHVWFASWRAQHKRQRYWGDSFETSILRKLIVDRFPHYENQSEENFTDFVEAYFNSNASAHILSRKMWEIMTHDSCRNLLISTGLLLIGLSAYAIISSKTAALIFGPIIGVAVVDYLFLWKYMSWSIRKYYEYNVDLVSTELLKDTSPLSN